MFTLPQTPLNTRTPKQAVTLVVCAREAALIEVKTVGHGVQISGVAPGIGKLIVVVEGNREVVGAGRAEAIVARPGQVGRIVISLFLYRSAEIVIAGT